MKELRTITGRIKPSKVRGAICEPSKCFSFLENLNEKEVTLKSFVNDYLKSGEYQNFCNWLKGKIPSTKNDIFLIAIDKFMEER